MAATANQVYSIVNELYAQATGRKANTSYDASGLVSIGSMVLSSVVNKEAFTGVLVDRISKLVISERAYKSKNKSMKMDPIEFGAIIQKLDCERIPAAASATWSVSNGSTSDINVVKPALTQKFFTGFNVWESDITIPDVQLKQAFTSAEEMLKLFNVIYQKLSNGREVELDNMVNATYCTAIANRLIYEKDPESVRTATGTAKETLVVDLRSAYNTFYGLSSGDTGYLATAADANRSPEFLRFCAKTIGDYKKWFTEYGVQFNQPMIDANGNPHFFDRHTPNEFLRLSIVADFISQYNNVCQSDTFHNELTALPMYEEVNFWQAPGAGHSTCRKVQCSVMTNYTTDGSEIKYTVAQDGIIAVMSDYESMGVTMNNERRKAKYDEYHEVTCVYDKAEKGYFFDPGENCVIFVVADSIANVTKVV